METEATSRSVSVQILNDFDAHNVLRYDTADKLESPRRAEIREYVQNILRRRSYLDFLIDHFSNVGVEEMKPNLKNILRLGIYDMLFMDSSPDYAAINEAVNLAKLELGSRTGDLVNAIMRNMQREAGNLPKPSYDDRNKLVAVTFSHPEWLVERWRNRFGEKEAFALMQANNQRPVYFVRANNLRTKTTNFELRMTKHDVPFAVNDLLPGYFEVESVAPFINEKWIAKGFCLVQDVAAGIAPFVVDPEPGEKIIDLCAAPGTKAIVMSDLMGAEGEVLAVDVSSDRLRLLADSAVRCRAENIKIRRADATEVELGKADGVLVDAPCTGTGVLSKRADLRWRRSPGDLEDCVELQEKLLNSAAKMVKPGGRLVYSTCSIEDEENMQQVNKFLETHMNFELESLEDDLPDDVLTEDGKAYQTYPHKHGCDGHFGVRMRMTAG